MVSGQNEAERRKGEAEILSKDLQQQNDRIAQRRDQVRDPAPSLCIEYALNGYSNRVLRLPGKWFRSLDQSHSRELCPAT